MLHNLPRLRFLLVNINNSSDNFASSVKKDTVINDYIFIIIVSFFRVV